MQKIVKIWKQLISHYFIVNCDIELCSLNLSAMEPWIQVNFTPKLALPLP